jgi:hypothetical protein
MIDEPEGEMVSCKTCPIDPTTGKRKLFWRPKGATRKQCRDCRDGLVSMIDRMARIKKNKTNG